MLCSAPLRLKRWLTMPPTLLPGLPDVSPEFEDTWAFLDRRIADTMAAGKAIKELTQAASTWLEGSMRK
jgi:COQ9